MIRAVVYGGLALVVAIGAWLFWSETHPDPVLARARTEQAERFAADPPPTPSDEATIDAANIEHMEAVREMSRQLIGVVAAYCAQKGRMPTNMASLGIREPPQIYRMDGIDLRHGGLEFRLAATELIPAGTLRFAPVLDGTCPAAEWHCTTTDYPQISRWLPECTYLGEQ